MSLQAAQTFSVAGRIIGQGHPPFIIAEMSGNHNGSLARARQIVEMVAEAGADAIKLQTYTADTMTIRSNAPEFTINNKESLWYGRTLYELYQEAHTPWEWHQELFDYARKLGLIAFSTPFDATAVDFLTSLSVPMFKIASFENTDYPLIKKVASTGKPMIISSGTATLGEVERAVGTARLAGAEDIIVLKCTSAYPAPHKESNLLSIPHLSELLGVPVGLSDHTLGVGASVAAIALGAVVIEKHVTLSRDDGGVDSAFSLDPTELRQLVVEGRRAWEALGEAEFSSTVSEQASKQFRRAIYVVKDMKEGEKFTPENIRVIRPGNVGLSPEHYEGLIAEGRAACDITAGSALKLHHTVTRPNA